MAPEQQTFKHRILIVDDEQSVRDTLGELLSQAGYEVLTANDGFEGLAAMRVALPHLIISDLRMPNMSGFEFLGIVRKRFPSVTVIAISAEFTPSSAPIDLLADRYLQKGQCPPMEVLETVRELLSSWPVRSQPARAEFAPVWVPRSRTNYVVLTCPECLRSFSILLRHEPGRGPDEQCPHCDSTVRYCIDETLIAQATSGGPASVAEDSRKRAEFSKKSIEDSQQAIARQKKRTS